MLQRAVVAVGLTAMLYVVVDAKPKTKLQRKWAAVIDTDAPHDPPVPWESSGLSVLFLIDRSIYTPQLDAVRSAVRSLHDALDDADLAAIIAFDATIDLAFRATDWVGDSRRKFRKALAGITVGAGGNLATALDEARDYMFYAPGRKVIIVFADLSKLDDKQRAAMDALADARIELVLAVLPGASSILLQGYDFRRTRHIYWLDDRSAASQITAGLENLRY